MLDLNYFDILCKRHFDIVRWRSGPTAIVLHQKEVMLRLILFPKTIIWSRLSSLCFFAVCNKNFLIDFLTLLQLPPPVKSSNCLLYRSFLSLFCHKLTDPHFPIVSSIFFLGSEVLFSERGMFISREYLSFFSFAGISREKVPLYGLLLLAEAACSNLPHFVPQLLTILVSIALVAASIDDVWVYRLDFFLSQEGVDIFKLLGSEVVTHYFYLAYGYLR